MKQSAPEMKCNLPINLLESTMQTSVAPTAWVLLLYDYKGCYATFEERVL